MCVLTHTSSVDRLIDIARTWISRVGCACLGVPELTDAGDMDVQ